MFTTLIEVNELQVNLPKLQAADWVAVDCRFALNDSEWGRAAYAQSHIPGAYYAHLDEDLSGEILPGKTGRHPLPPIDQLAKLFTSWGISGDTQVVVYDQGPGGFAGRLWWLLNWLGHTRVAVLNGGFAAWQAAGLTCNQDVTPAKNRDFAPNVQGHLVAEVDEVLKMSQQTGEPKGLLVDSREAVRYRGEEEPIDPVAGHIPSAICAPFQENLRDGQFRPTAELQQRFTSLLAAQPAEKTVFYCGSGVTACHNLLALKHAGLGMARLYPGSWSEWITDAGRTDATGS